MDIYELPAEEAAVRRCTEELWLPYHRELESKVDAHALADDVDLVAEEVVFRLDRLGQEGNRTWIAVDEPAEDDLATADGDLAGFVTTEVDESPVVFARPDRLIVGDIYVGEHYRGTGLARELMDRAVADAREAGCGQLALDVNVDNDRAVAFYDALGSETYRRRMTTDVTGA